MYRLGRMRSYVALTAVFAGVFVAADDQTVVVTVLPRIMLDLNLTVTELGHTSWIITGYLLGYVAAMPFIGRLSDVWGHRNAFIGSLLLFMLGSVGVAMATDINWLIGLRVFQALGAGALVPIAIAIVGDLFPPERRGAPLGLVGASAEAGGVIGPLWGGIVTKYLAWQWVFWLNVPMCAVIIALALFLLPKSRRHPARMDYIGGALITLSLAALTLGLARIDEPDALMALWLALAVVSLAMFIVRQRKASDPLLPRAMFRARAFVAANATPPARRRCAHYRHGNRSSNGEYPSRRDTAGWRSDAASYDCGDPVWRGSGRHRLPAVRLPAAHRVGTDAVRARILADERLDA